MKKILVVSVCVFLLQNSLTAQQADVLKSNGIMNEGQRNYQAAAQSYAKAVKVYKAEGVVDTLSMFKAGHNYTRVKEYSKALPFLLESTKLNYQDANIYLILAKAYKGLNQLEKSEEALHNGVVLFPERKADYLKQLAYNLIHTKQYDKAVATLEESLSEHPHHVETLYLLGTTLEKQKKYKGAIRQYETILNVDAEHIKSTKRLGYIYFKQADILYNKELKRYEAIQNPSRVDYSKSVKKLEVLCEGYSKALPLLEKTQQRDPANETIANCLFVAYKRLKMDDKAMKIKVAKD